MEAQNYVAQLNEYAQRTRSELKYEDVGSVGPDHIKTFTLRAVLNGKVYPDGVGKNKKEAKQNAAKNALRGLRDNPVDPTEDEKCSVASSAQKEELIQNVSDICDMTKNLNVKTKDEGLTEINYIDIINRHCQKEKLSHDYVLEKKCGPSHDPQFFYKLVINNKDNPVGEGKSVKEAKQNAARLAWSAIQGQSDKDSKILPITKIQSPNAKPKIRIAANFRRNSKEDKINFNGQTNSGISRFTSEFDSIVPLSKGAFGHVFKAKRKLLDKCFAIKIVHCKEKALREVTALSDLHHCNIVRYYSCWLEDSGYQCDSASDSGGTSQLAGDSMKYLYIDMELCDTKTLTVWINEKNTQSLHDSKRREESLSIAQQIVSGVEYIHSKKHIHRDLKPDNILFGMDGEVKIGDFGLVTKDDDDAMMDRTLDKGTPIYMAPEQRNTKTYDRKVDIFPLGLIYFELLWKLSTGHERVVVLGDARCQTLPKEFSPTFPQESQIIKSMLCEKPEDRPEASTVKAELEKWAQMFSAQQMSQKNATV